MWLAALLLLHGTLVAFSPWYVIPETETLDLAYLNMLSFLISGILVRSMYGLCLYAGSLNTICRWLLR